MVKYRQLRLSRSPRVALRHCGRRGGGLTLRPARPNVLVTRPTPIIFMLKPVKKARARARAGRFVIVASKYNGRYVNAMLRAAQATLKQANAEAIEVVRVPGAFEIPVVVSHVARRVPRPAAVLCLGVILRGATTHAQHIGEVVSDALGRIAVETGVPVIHEVLLLENEQQARERCLDQKHNRGAEAAQTALEMGAVVARL